MCDGVQMEEVSDNDRVRILRYTLAPGASTHRASAVGWVKATWPRPNMSRRTVEFGSRCD